MRIEISYEWEYDPTKEPLWMTMQADVAPPDETNASIFEIVELKSIPENWMVLPIEEKKLCMDRAYRELHAAYIEIIRIKNETKRNA